MSKIRAIIKKRLNNKKGSAVIEYTIGLLLLVTLICFLFDVLIIAHKNYIVSQQVNTMARKIAIQGGVLPKTPKGMYGGDGNYFTGSKLIKGLNTTFNGAGIEKDEWSALFVSYDSHGNIVSSLAFDGEDTNIPSKGISIDYGNGIDVSVTYSYDWTLFGQITGNKNKTTKTETRHVMSEFKYDYDKWDGE